MALTLCLNGPAQVKVGSLKLLTLLAKCAPPQLAAQLPTIVPTISECMYDAKQQVKVIKTDITPLRPTEG